MRGPGFTVIDRTHCRNHRLPSKNSICGKITWI